MSIDSLINESFAKVADVSEAIAFYSLSFQTGDTEHSLPLILLWLALPSLFFTVYLGFANIRYFGRGFKLLFKKDDEKADGQISSWQALAASLSATVGLGNIAGVAVAITMGGPGAALWMVIMGFLGMSTKFSEIMLAIKYRHHPNKEHKEKIAGGPMYYLRDIFANKGIPKIGMTLAIIFGVCTVLGAVGGGNMFQANQSFTQFVAVTGGEDGFWADKGWLFGIGLGILVGIVIIGGIKKIASVSSKLVPAMGLVYLCAAFLVIAVNIDSLPQAMATIWTEAFSVSAGIGGFIGALLAGVQRASFSNEAGLGSAAIVYSAVKSDQPVEQGLIGMLGPFIDTVVVCMATALMIVISGVYQDGSGVEGVDLTSRAMAEHFSWMPYVLFLSVFMFAYSTIITWFYYGEKALQFVGGQSKALSLSYKLIYCGFVVVGASSELRNVIRFSDAMIFSMAIPNIIGLYVAAPEIKRDLKKYIQATVNK